MYKDIFNYRISSKLCLSINKQSISKQKLVYWLQNFTKFFDSREEFMIWKIKLF